MHLSGRLKRIPRFVAFTLVEALIGVAVMGTVFVSLYAGMATGFQSIRASQQNLRATQIMVEKFEAMRLFNWDQINTPGFVPLTFTAKFAPNSSSPGITYTGTIRISPVLGQPVGVFWIVIDQHFVGLKRNDILKGPISETRAVRAKR